MASDILVKSRIVRLSLYNHLVWSCALKNSWGNEYEANIGSYWSWEKNNLLREMEKSCCDRDAWCLHVWLRYMMPPHVIAMHDAFTCDRNAWCLYVWLGCMMPSHVIMMHDASTCDRNVWCLHVWQGFMMPPRVTGMHDASMCDPDAWCFHVIRMHDASTTCDRDAWCFHM